MAKPRTEAWRVISATQTSISLCDESIYNLKYEVGKVTTARKDTFGIFCFSDQHAAERYTQLYHQEQVIRVMGIGKPTYPAKIANSWSWITDSGLKKFYEYLRNKARPDFHRDMEYEYDKMDLPLSLAVCYPQVLVLE